MSRARSFATSGGGSARRLPTYPAASGPRPPTWPKPERKSSSLRGEKLVAPVGTYGVSVVNAVVEASRAQVDAIGVGVPQLLAIIAPGPASLQVRSASPPAPVQQVVVIGTGKVIEYAVVARIPRGALRGFNIWFEEQSCA